MTRADQSSTFESIRFQARDGCPLSGRYWEGAAASERSVLLLPALGSLQGYFRWFAEYLASCGFGVMTVDYRGTGVSRGEAVDHSISADDWIERDIPGAVDELRKRTGARFLGVVANSISGQYFGQSPARLEADGLMLLAAQRGLTELFHGLGWLQLQYAYLIVPLLIRAIGRVPASKATLPILVPNAALQQWVRWGRERAFSNEMGLVTDPRFSEYHGPLTAVTFSDDSVFAPAAAVDYMTTMYSGATAKRVTLVPSDYGLKRLGHFGFFHRRAPRSIWDRVVELLRELEAAAVSGRSQG